MDNKNLIINDNPEEVNAKLKLLERDELEAILDETRAVLARTDFIQYCKYVHDWDLEPHHKEWAEILMNETRACVIAPPESGKSRLMRSFIEWNIGRNPEWACLLVQNTGRQASLQVSAMGGVLTSYRYQKVFPTIKATDRWSGEKLFVVRNTHRPDATVAGYGIDGAYQGAHVDAIIVDDPTDQRDVLSPQVMQIQKDLMKGVLYDRLNKDYADARFFVILTRWGDDDLVKIIQEDLNIPIHVYPAVRDEAYAWGSKYLSTAYNEEKLKEIRSVKGPDLFKLTFLCSSSGAVVGKRVFGDQLYNDLLVHDINHNEVRYVKGAAGVDWGCLTLDTEILTKDGWKTHDRLEEGELVAGFDWGDTQTVVWTPLRRKIYKQDQPLVRMKSKSFDFTCTPDHAWIVKRTKRGSMIKDTYTRQNLDTISRHKTSLVISRSCYDEGTLPATMGEAAVLGWLVTDGWIQKDGAFICQKNNCASVISDLQHSGLSYTEIKTQKNGTRVWRLSNESFRYLKKVTGFTDKENLPSLVTRLSPEAQNQMSRAMLEAEGTKNGTDRYTLFCQKRGPVMDAMQILLALRGVRTGVERKHQSQYGESNRLPILRSTNIMVPTITTVEGIHNVWCPSVGEGAVIARQRGQVTITGNTTTSHKSAIVCATQREDNIVVIRGAWTSHTGSSAELIAKLAEFRTAYGIRNAWIDRSQGSLRDQIEHQLGMGAFKGEASVELRIGALKTLLELGLVVFDGDGPGMGELWNQLTSYARDANGRIIEKADDLVDACLYCLCALWEPSKFQIGTANIKFGGVFDKNDQPMRDAHTDDFDPTKWSDPVKKSTPYIVNWNRV